MCKLDLNDIWAQIAAGQDPVKNLSSDEGLVTSERGGSSGTIITEFGYLDRVENKSQSKKSNE